MTILGIFFVVLGFAFAFPSALMLGDEFADETKYTPVIGIIIGTIFFTVSAFIFVCLQ